MTIYKYYITYKDSHLMDPINIGDDKLLFGTGRARRACEALPSFDVVTEIGQSCHGCVENGGCLIEEEKRE